jgi:hypothetical protein
VRRYIEIALSSLKRVFALGETSAITLSGSATTIAAKIAAYAHAFLVDRLCWGDLEVASRSRGHENLTTDI